MSDVQKHIEREKASDPVFAEEWEQQQILTQIALSIINLREKLGMTQEEFADFVGLQQSVIARLESRRHLPSIRTLQKIAQKTGMRLHIVIDEEAASILAV